MNNAQILAPGARQVRNYGERLLKGITPEMFARKPRVNGQLVEMNHPAFIYGHLATYPVMIAGMVGLPSEQMVVPASYEGLFKINCPCHDDVEGTIYPSMEEITTLFFRGMDAVLAALPEIDEAQYDKPLADAGRQERFGSVGAFCAYLLLAHPQGHFGQVSGWRRCMGLGSA